ncbi:hypothetical protein HWV23_06595 [Natronomonas halophila]|uniref:hypothetical protein n=1 Tax=Natronomonas halophila TaxID=2747817 RepID=UPI0015B3B673|nr:hypothetical protein [Natronomonas halophila]QLD85409.1 hypothetical protein HWV23_06595 [Natronomonas halophila]
MDIELVRKSVGDTGTVGLLLVAVGVVVFGRKSLREGLGALAIGSGAVLVIFGLFGQFLKEMGMGFSDLT